MKHRVTRFKDLTVALQELKPFVRDGRHLQSGRPFKSFGDMRSREVLANWLVCAAINSTGEKTVTFSSDPIGGDGVIIDIATKETWQTEHVMVPRYRSGQAANTRTRILEAIDKKRSKGGTAYARGKTLIVFLDGGGGPWKPNEVARALPKPLLFSAIWVVALQNAGVAGRYIYCVTLLESRGGNAPIFLVQIEPDFANWSVNRRQ